MACGIPVIATAEGATDDFIDDSCGYRIPSYKIPYPKRLLGTDLVSLPWFRIVDFKALVETMRRIALHPEDAQVKGKAARAKAISQWIWQHAADKVIKRKVSLDPVLIIL
jgi:glycosyltransferase involved in cell wall biosynthesis